MKRLWHYLTLVISLLVLFFLATASVTLLQVPEWCVSPDGAPVGCAEVTLSPSTALADFYLGETLLAQQKNPGQLILPPNTSHRIDVRNIQDTSEGFGTLYVYQDTSTNIYVREGQVSRTTVTLRKTYIRGTLNLTCDIRNVVAGNSVACRVTIDGTPQAADLTPGAKASYILDPGSHTVRVELVGEQASLWDPASIEQTVTITEGRTTNLSPRFNKRGHLLIALDQPGVVGDFYVDGSLVAQQVAGMDLWVAPNVNHKIEVRNLVDPAAAGIYFWKDATTTAYLSAGQERTVTLRLQKQYLKGFLDVVCDVRNYIQGESVGCRVTIDGVPQAADLTPGQTANYTLDPGSHALRVDLVGEQAFRWAPSFQERTASVSAGRTGKVSFQFNKAGHLIAVLDRPGVVGDFYLNGVLVAQQVARLDTWVEPDKPQTVEFRNPIDQVRPGYHWKITTPASTVRIASGQEKTITFNLEPDIEAAERAVQQICTSGVGVPEAASYLGGPGLHPILLFNAGGGSHVWSNQATAWAPASVLDVQLAACIGPQRENLLEECLYHGPSIFRYQYSIDVWLVAVQTGSTVAATTLWGDPPRECRMWEPYWLVRLAGPQVAWYQLRDWLQPWVSP